MSNDIHPILEKDFVRALVKEVCGKETELITRPAAYVVRARKEDERDIERLIILPPKGYTANTLNQTNSHDEAEYATIQVKGAVRDDKNGFSKIKDCLLIAGFHERGQTSELNQPYLTFTLDREKNPGLMTAIHSSGTAPFSVVKPDGYGFYHNLINMTDEWLVLQLFKKLRPQRKPDLSEFLSSVTEEQAELISGIYNGIISYGDDLFKINLELIDKIVALPLNVSLPALGEMLYVHDTGKHEACTAFAVILKIGKQKPEEVTTFLQETIEKKSIPSYYARQLISKIATAHKSKEKAA